MMHNLESPTLTPLLGVGGVTRYEVQRISIDCTDKEQRALSYESSGRVTTNHKIAGSTMTFYKQMCQPWLQRMTQIHPHL